MSEDSRRIGLGNSAALAAAAVLCAAYVVYFATLASFPLQDLPNHLARAEVISDLLFNGGARFGDRFAVQLAPIPYVLHDLFFATLVHLFGARAGATVFMTVVLLSLPCALLLYMHVTGAAPRARLVIAILSLFLSTDRFFLMGFFGFRLAIALVVASLASAEWLRRAFTGRRYAVYLSLIAVGYFTHLTAPAFFLLVISISAAVRFFTRTSTFGREALLVLPVAIPLIVYFLFVHAAYAPTETTTFLYEWGRLSDKFHAWSFEFGRFGDRPSQMLLLMLGLCGLFGVWRALNRGSLNNALVIENLLIAVAFVCVYILLPRQYPDSGYVDVRALVMVSISLLIASLWLAHSLGGAGYGTLPVQAFALLLVALNLGWIAENLGPLDRWISRYREVAAVVPLGARVLPVATRSRAGGNSSSLRSGALLHAGSFLVIDRRAVMPYLFSRNRGDPMKYFFYRNRPYMPQESWYTEQVKWRAAVPATYRVLGQDYTWRFHYSVRDKVWEPLPLVPVDWRRIACDYDWLLVTKPYESQFIQAQTRVVRQNDAAALLAITRRSCPPAKHMLP